VRMGFIDHATPVTFQLYSEVLQKFRLAAQGASGPQPPREHRARIETHFDPLPFWYPPLDHGDEHLFPMHAVTQRPMAMYHSWGSQNAWLRQLHSSNRLYLGSARAGEMGLRAGDWVWIISRHGRIKVQIRLMEGVNPDTCWTWNAIGKRAGAWHLSPQAPEATKGFLLNHLIDELLPDQGSGYRYANADPVTGQAAWYDLRVRLEKASAAEAGVSAPQLPALTPPRGLPEAPRVLRYGQQFRRRARP
jgi:sulfite dehydrogenase (quinone) subunit SoeA